MRISEDLRQRCKAYASAIVRFYRWLPTKRREVEEPGQQLLRSGTSVAGHSLEASRVRSDAEFCSKLDGLFHEAEESHLWLELLKEDCHKSGEQIDFLVIETKGLLAMFVTIVSKTRKTLSFQHLSITEFFLPCTSSSRFPA